MVPGGLPSSPGRDALIAARKTSKARFGEAKKQRPLIRYAGSAAETSISSKPIGSELSCEFYSASRLCQGGCAIAWPCLGQWGYPRDMGDSNNNTESGT